MSPAKQPREPRAAGTAAKKTPAKASSTTSTKKTSSAGAVKKTTKSTAKKPPARKQPAAGSSATGKAASKGAAPKRTTSAKSTGKKPPVKKKAPTTKAGAGRAGSKEAPREASKERAPKSETSAGVAGKAAVAGAAVAVTAAVAGKVMSKPSTTGPPARKKTVRPPRRVKFSREELATIRKKLEDERADLQKQIAEIDEESFEGTQSDITGEVGLDDDFADAGTATFDRERALSIQNNIRDLIDQMTRAIERIDDGNYGVCERCGRPIDGARLKALPHALLCMDCKRREERAR